VLKWGDISKLYVAVQNWWYYLNFLFRDFIYYFFLVKIDMTAEEKIRMHHKIRLGYRAKRRTDLLIFQKIKTLNSTL